MPTSAYPLAVVSGLQTAFIPCRFSAGPSSSTRRTFGCTQGGEIGPGHEHQQTVPIADLIADGESEHLEFKSALRMNLNTQTTDRRVELGALKTLAAF